MNNKVIDGMKRESKNARNATILCYLIAILMPLVNYLINNDKFSDKDILAIFLCCENVEGISNSAVKYKVEFNNEKIYLKTLFFKKELNIDDIEKYTCNRYRQSVFYQFNLFIKDKKISISTRYKDEFEKILKDKKIEQITK